MRTQYCSSSFPLYLELAARNNANSRYGGGHEDMGWQRETMPNHVLVFRQEWSSLQAARNNAIRRNQSCFSIKTGNVALTDLCTCFASILTLKVHDSMIKAGYQFTQQGLRKQEKNTQLVRLLFFAARSVQFESR